jgi:hypothetical protein
MLPETLDVPNRNVDENLLDILDEAHHEGPIPNSTRASPQPPDQEASGHRVCRLPQRFKDLLPSAPILLRQYSEPDARLKTALDEARRRRQPKPRTDITFEEENLTVKVMHLLSKLMYIIAICWKL